MRQLRTMTLVAATVAALGATGCGGDDSASSGGGSAGSSGSSGGETIGLSVPSLAESFWISIAYGVQDQAKKMNVKVVTANAGGDDKANQQISQIQDLVQRNVKGLIVGATNADAVKSVVDQAGARGIPVVGASSVPAGKLVSQVFTDNPTMGQMQAECLGSAMGGKGQVAVLGGPPAQTWADARLDGFKKTLAEKYPDIKIVATSRSADNRNAALTMVEGWLQRFTSLKGIYSATDDIGSGAVDAIEAAKKSGTIDVSSSNFSPAAEQLLKKGSFACVSVQEIVEQGRQAVIQAVNAARGKPVKETVVTPVIKLTKENFSDVDFGPIRAPEGFKP
jgi:ABC-type sugar transport system substrate-binding protein